jgi:hypothetical protein
LDEFEATTSPVESEIDRRRRWLALAMLGAPLCATPYFRSIAAGSKFPVFDALEHRGKPNLSRQGLVPMLSVARVWRPGSPKDSVDEAGVLAALEQLPRGADTIYVDIENWPLLGVAENIRSQHVDNYLMTAKIIRRAKPHIRFGFYGIAPLFAYWPIVRQDKEQLAEWRVANQALRPLADWVDFVLPSLYTYYDNPAGWRQFASATLEEARQYKKPVYPFLWYEYFDGNLLLRGKQVNLADWGDELKLCRERADGIVLWGGYQRNWSDSAGWWKTVLALMGDLPGAAAGLTAP